jgi:hypothetical protein
MSKDLKTYLWFEVGTPHAPRTGPALYGQPSVDIVLHAANYLRLRNWWNGRDGVDEMSTEFDEGRPMAWATCGGLVRIGRTTQRQGY